jgi:hypothetical protein
MDRAIAHHSRPEGIVEVDEQDLGLAEEILRVENLGVVIGEHRAEHCGVRISVLILWSEHWCRDCFETTVLTDQPLLVDEQRIRRRGD